MRDFKRAGVLCCLSLCAAMGACAGHDAAKPPPTATGVDLQRYAGTWYEVARLPMWAQRKCVTSTADYRLLESGDIGVRNACMTAGGETLSIEGVAAVVDPQDRAKLNVVFDQWASKLVAWLTSSEQGNYWILRLDAEYRWAVVGTPDRKYLWILSRAPDLPESTYQELIAFSRQQGFPTERLIRAPTGR